MRRARRKAHITKAERGRPSTATRTGFALEIASSIPNLHFVRKRICHANSAKKLGSDASIVRNRKFDFELAILPRKAVAPLARPISDLRFAGGPSRHKSMTLRRPPTPQARSPSGVKRRCPQTPVRGPLRNTRRGVTQHARAPARQTPQPHSREYVELTRPWHDQIAINE